jgi:flagellar biosynthesis protein FlgN
MQTLGNGPAVALASELEAANALLQLLKQEQAHLIEANVDGVSALTEEKSKLVARMGELALQRYRGLAAAGFQAGEAGMRDWLQTPAASTQSNQTWNELLQIAATSKELNRTNGLLIGQYMARNQTALNILWGNRPGDTIYGPNGQATAQTNSRRFVVG